MGKTEKERRRKRRRRRRDLLVEWLQVGRGEATCGEGAEGGQQSWRGAARSQHPSAFGPHPPGGPEEEG
jgi:hypothetical protein